MKSFISFGTIGAALLAGSTCLSAAQLGDVHINELAWMGTTVSTNDEWIELRNTTTAAIDLTGWTLEASDGTPSIYLVGSIPKGGFFLLERSNDASVPGIAADQIYVGALENGGEIMELRDTSGTLIDSVDAWYAGVNATKETMERNATGWQTSTVQYDVGIGTPKAANSGTSTPPTGTTQHLNQVSNAPGSINVYFNKSALPDYATTGNEANWQINLEEQLIARISTAQISIDVATYEINLPGIVDALIERAAAGVTVRVLTDAKDPTDAERTARYDQMRLNLEKMARGQDGVVGTADDVHLYADSIIFAVEDTLLRADFGFPIIPSEFPSVAVTVGNAALTGYRIADGEEKSPGAYYSAGDQMHNKHVVIDGEWIWTGSWNFTITGLYGSDANRAAGILDGNTQNSIELNSTIVADAFTTEYNEMWGDIGTVPNPTVSNFHSRKIDNTPHVFDVGGRTVELYFSPGDNAVGNVTSMVQTNADVSAYFSIFAWSDQALVDALKVKWEGSGLDLQGTLTGFDIKGVFDASFWNQWWSASVDMTGRTASQTSVNNPNTRWANPAPVFIDAEVRKLHSKTMLIDACTASDPTVVIGSTNWSANGNDVNDENMLYIHDSAIANQFVQQFFARYQAAGGSLPVLGTWTCP